MKVVVFGGSAQSTPALWWYLVHEARLEGLHVVLMGRDRARLEAVIRACRLLAGSNGNHLSAAVAGNGSGSGEWSVLEDAAIVLIQVRSGGYGARVFDETFPLRY